MLMDYIIFLLSMMMNLYINKVTKKIKKREKCHRIVHGPIRKRQKKATEPALAKCKTIRTPAVDTLNL
jgi:hypothetical protein